jgi:hypothetical protein
MRNKLSMTIVAFLLPLVFGWGMARAADQPAVNGARIVLADGSLVNGAVSFVIDLDTPYGQIKIPSSNLVSAQFDAQQKWADIRLNDAEMKLKYNPATSDLKATTAAGALTIALANVTQVGNVSAQRASNAAPQAAPSQNMAQAYAQQPPAASVPQAPPANAYQYPYQYPYQYQYAQPAPDYGYGSVPYYGGSYYDYGGPYYGGYYGYGWPYYGYYGYGWPYLGFGYGWGWGRGFRGGFHGGFGGGFHGGGFHGGGFHGGFGGGHGGGHR